MKTTISLKSLSLFFMSAAILSTSCKKEAEQGPSEQEAAEAVSQSITSERGGFVTQVDNSIGIALRHNQPAHCGQEKDTTLAANYSGLAINYSYNLNWNWKLTCVSNVPARVNFSYSGTSAYKGIMISSNDKITSAMEIAGLAPSSTEYIINKQVVREGMHNSTYMGQSNFTGKTTLASSNITVDKASRKIKSGVVHVNVAFGGNSTHQYQGQVTFNGNNTATLLLNSGKSYIIRW